MSKVKRVSRRQFLKDSRDTASAASFMFGLNQLFASLLYSPRVWAQSSSYDLRYVNFLLPGGPPRWFFDQPLNPSGRTQDFVPGQFGTEIHSIGTAPNWAPIHRTYPVKFGSQNVHLPPLWRLNSAALGKPFSEILQNTLMIRGVDMVINSHVANQARTVRPVLSNPSITGQVSDRSSAPFPSIGFSDLLTTESFKSAKNFGVIQVNPANPVPTIVAPFKTTLVADHTVSMNQAFSEIEAAAQALGLPSVGGGAPQKAALEFIKFNLNSFQTKWSALRAKYQDIVDREFTAAFPGINSEWQSIVPSNHPYFTIAEGRTLTGLNLKAQFASAKVSQVAEAFAFAEFALGQNLSHSLSLSLGHRSLFHAGMSFVHDQHYHGAVLSTIFTSLYFRCVAGCLLELIGQLKAENTFSKTVLQFNSEFSRTPASDGSGSGHGYLGTSSTIVSGMIQQPALVGNISKNASGDYGATGSFGYAMPTTVTGSGYKKMIENDDVVATVCAMLKILRASVKGESLLKETSPMKWVLSRRWEAKNVA